MVPLTSLWLPILVASVFVLIASNLIWMVFQLHKKDWAPLPDEEAFAEAVNAIGVERGEYTFPYAADMAAWKSEEWQAKWKRGPVGFLTLQQPGEMNMGKTLGIWFFYILVIQVFVAYLTSQSLAAGAHYLEVFQIAGTAAILGFAGGAAPQAIWMGRRWRNALGLMGDGIVYGLLTAGTFGWLWPGA